MKNQKIYIIPIDQHKQIDLHVSSEEKGLKREI